MTRMTIPSIIASVALALVSPSDLLAQRGRPGEEPILQHFTSTVETFESDAIGRDATYRIYLPLGYEEEANENIDYPLVLWLHGMWEDHNRFHSRGGAKVLDAMRGDDELPELVFVCVNATKASFYINGAAKDSNYEDLVAKDLMAHLEQTYRVEPAAGKRAICGVSMGGYGSLKIALRYPDRFGIVAAHSAAILPEDPDSLEQEYPWLKRWGGAATALRSIFGQDKLDPEKWLDENLLHIAQTVDPDSIAELKVYFDCGDEDPYGFFPRNHELHQLLEKRKIRHQWRLSKGGRHGWRSGYNTDALPHSLSFVAAAFAVDAAAAGLGGLFGGAKPEPAATDSSGRK